MAYVSPYDGDHLMADYIDIWHRAIVQDTWSIQPGDARYDRLTAPSGWRVASLSTYCGSSEYFVAEFVDNDGNCSTFYGTIESIQEQADRALG